MKAAEAVSSVTSGLAVIFLDLKPKGEETKAKINKGDDIKLTSCIAKETIKEVKRQPRNGGKISVNHISW